MEKLRLRRLANARILAGLFLSAGLTAAICAQVPRQLHVEVGRDQQVRILASDVSYGEVLRVLQGKLGWVIEIPPIADELKLPYVSVEAKQPQIALEKLLEGSRLGYAFLEDGSRSGRMRVVVIALPPHDASSTQKPDSSASMPDNPPTGASLPLSSQAQAGSASQPSAGGAETAGAQPPAAPTMPLADAIAAIGVPPGVSPAEVGRAMTFPISDAARIMGFPPGVSPVDIGKTITMPLPTGPGKRP